MSGKLIRIDVNGEITMSLWSKRGRPNWELLRDLVGGYTERVKVRWERKLRDAYVNENGVMERLPFNIDASRLCDGFFKGTCILGPMVIWVPDAKVKAVS